ncbi:Virulence protein [Lactobacillus helveticus]|nr:Virulence protein [Lactobacillus helveticus]
MPIVDEQNGFVSLQCGDQLIRRRKKTNGVNAIVAKQLETGVFDFCLQTDQPIKNVIAKYKSNNQEIISGPVEKHGAHGKMTFVYTRDPDGNLVEVCSYE